MTEDKVGGYLIAGNTVMADDTETVKNTVGVKNATEEENTAVGDSMAAGTTAKAEKTNVDTQVYTMNAADAAKTWNPTTIFAIVWIAGAAGILTWQMVCSYRWKKSLGQIRVVEDNICTASGVTAPFVMGLLHPQIYVPEWMSTEETKYVLLHERTHIRRRDYQIKVAAFAIACVHWFNPFAWLAYHLMCMDMEMSCDEAVVKQMKVEQKKGYATTLLSFANRTVNGSSVAFAEPYAKKRIRNVLTYRHPAVRMTALLTVLCLALAGCLLTDPVKDHGESEREKGTISMESEEESHEVSTGEVTVKNVSTSPQSTLTGTILANASQTEGVESVTPLRCSFNTQISSMAVTSQGIFFAEQFSVSGIEGYQNMYFDVHTKEAVPLCMNESCAHKIVSCSAVYGMGMTQTTVSPLGVYEDKLYILESEESNSILRLYCCDLNGQNREQIWEESYPSSNEMVEDRLLITESVIWDKGKVYISYFSQDLLQKYVTTNLAEGILCIDVAAQAGPIKVCEEASNFTFLEKEEGGTEEYSSLYHGDVTMMAVKDGTVYYSHQYTDAAPDWNSYKLDEATYENEWESTFKAVIEKAAVQNGQVNKNEVLALGENDGYQNVYYNCVYYNDRIYYKAQEMVYLYDMSTGQSTPVVDLNGSTFVNILDGWIISRNFEEEKFFFCNLESGEILARDAHMGIDLYGSMVLDGQTYWLLRVKEQNADGEKVYRWYLVEPESYLREEAPERWIVTEYDSTYFN